MRSLASSETEQVNSVVVPEVYFWKMYWHMMKPTISFLVVVTVVPSLIMASGGLPSAGLFLATLGGTFLASGSAGMFNHLVDSDIDSHMVRTKSRPIPAGHVSRPLAFCVASILGALSFWILWVFAHPLAAWVALAANAFYVVIYTMILKRRTVQNIVIGGAAGAVGPLIGSAAASGHIDWTAWALFAIIFLWTPPHFWALAIKYRDDYRMAGIPMLPSVRGVRSTITQIFLYTWTLLPPVAALSVGGQAGWIYGLVAISMTLYFIWMAFKLYRTQDEAKAMPLFLYSCLYLFGIFGALTLDRLWYLS